MTDETIPTELDHIRPLVVNVARKQTFDLYVGRTSRGHADSGWGNPYPLRSNSTKARLECVMQFYDHLNAESSLQARLHELEGRVLACWCSPRLCHAHLLAARASVGKSTTDDWVNALRTRQSELPYRLLVTGSRAWTDVDTIRTALLEQWRTWGRPVAPVLVVGGAAGADAIAAELWNRAGFPVETHLPDWEGLGRRAGMVRNSAMISTGVDAALAFSLAESPGTKQCYTAAQKAGVPTTVHRAG